ncbi:MAG: hypothetical protein U0359_12445 [Byssovorax sp.]
MKNRGFLGSAVILACLVAAAPASANVPECGDVPIDRWLQEGLANCEVRINAECTASCTELGIYKTRCATKLTQVCGQQCTLSANATCTDSCTVQCKGDCDQGVNIICSHNCFKECTTTRDTECAKKADAAQCSATWDANCDSECDAKCVTVDGGCYQHCVECCGGSCTADANMDCQYTCQDVKFEQCEQEFRADCDASCTGDGSLFCDGKYVMSGSDLPACINALSAMGIKAEVKGSISIGPDGVKGDITGGICAYGPGTPQSSAGPFAALAAAGVWLARRRRRSPGAGR